MNTHHTFKRGMALVIAGPQGVGKTTLARKIASSHGKYQEIETGPNFDFALRDSLNGRVKVLIIDGTPSQDELVEIKNLVTNPSIMIRKPFGIATVRVPSPLVIVCTLDVHWLHEGSRRFDVIDLSSNAIPGAR